MFEWLSRFFSFFLSGWGLLVLAFIDSSVFFFTPFANDVVVIILAARHRDLFWLFPLIATGGSLAGIAMTYWIGRKAGEAGLRRFVSTRQLSRLKERLKHKGAFAAGSLAVVPPPFPFTPMVLASGALDVSVTRFLLTAVVTRLLRFGAESLLARRYGSHIIDWLESPAFHWLIGGFIVITVAGTAFTIYRVARGPRGAKSQGSRKPSPHTA